MNIHRGFRIPESKLTSDNLAQENWNFANVLAAGRWRNRNIQKVELTRSIVDALGADTGIENDDVEPVFNEIMISFSAFKRVINADDGDYLVPGYVITSTTSQEISKEEIPERVLDEIFEDAVEVEHIAHSLLERPGPDDDDSSSAEGFPSQDNLDELELMRIQEVEYTINHNGELDDYAISYSYSIDDAEASEVGYRHSNNALVWAQRELSDGSMGEGKPPMLLILNEEVIKSEMNRFDTAYTEFVTNNALRELTEFSGLPKEEHIRRILGMVGLLSGGFTKLPKQPNPRPQRMIQ